MILLSLGLGIGVGYLRPLPQDKARVANAGTKVIAMVSGTTLCLLWCHF